MTDEVAHPKHYTSHPSGIEPIEITQHETFLRGNILKYVLRAPYKGAELSDLLKAQQYLEWEIRRVEIEAEKPNFATGGLIPKATVTDLGGSYLKTIVDYTRKAH